mmetsp:Transcript_31349/g.70430  ORF Transcript_31349/g.70430 Transcript_31349/m.70430 type:complete len:282 (+) Transcript_31349:90-935(+)|eukprot:CAMPEP_0172590622 /NCGR_PEP_ID=MMETSP1068-20121228/9181_1 /TAXON_ID=35684 /ORGANISM="Pseudopedinella elastica, Strain CCMP716" /LENGTH=281 /DNA_ID=CAMNT_0013386591 /DNA_START=44 /DNA_END=889 /DNA_ORIENTATION=-
MTDTAMLSTGGGASSMTSFRGYPEPGRASTPSFVKTRHASREVAEFSRSRTAGAVANYQVTKTPSWAAMSGNLPHAGTSNQRLTGVHIGSSRLDSSASFPEYEPKAAPGAHKAAKHPFPELAHDKGVVKGTRPQVWKQVHKARHEPAMTQANWPSSGTHFGKIGERSIRPTKKNHTNSTKREIELYGNRPVSPSRGRPGARVPEFSPISKIHPMGTDITKDNFGTSGHDRIYRSWKQDTRNSGHTVSFDGGPRFTSGARGKVAGVGLNSGLIMVSLDNGQP